MNKTFPILFFFFVLCSCTNDRQEASQIVAYADSLFAQGQVYADTARLQYAARNLSRNHDKEKLAWCYYYIGKNFSEVGEVEQAFDYFIQAERLHYNNHTLRGRIMTNFGYVCVMQHDTMALPYYKRAYENFRQTSDSISIGIVLTDIAQAFALFQMYDSAHYYFAQALPYYNQEEICYWYSTVANSYYYQHEYDSVLLYSYLALQTEKIPSDIQWNYRRIMQSYTQKGELDSARYYATFLSENSDEPAYLIDAYYHKIAQSEGLGNTEQVADYAHKSRDAYQQQLQIERERLKAIDKLKEYELSAKNDKSNHDIMILSIAIIILALLGLGVWICYIRKRAKKRENEIRHIKSQYFVEQTHKLEMLEATCKRLRRTRDIRDELYLNNYEKFCEYCNRFLFCICEKLQRQFSLSEIEVYLCILILIGFSHKQIADIIYRSATSIGKMKARLAKKLGTNGRDFRDFLIEVCLN